MIKNDKKKLIQKNEYNRNNKLNEKAEKKYHLQKKENGKQRTKR